MRHGPEFTTSERYPTGEATGVTCSTAPPTAQPMFERDDVQGVLNGSFYATNNERSQEPAKATETQRPSHYKVICISMYNDDLAGLDAKVAELKARGYTKANRSALIRHALSVVDLDQVPRGI